MFACEDGACRSCFLKHNLMKEIESTVCPRCSAKIDESKVVASKMMQDFISTLKLKCGKGCEQLVSLHDSNEHCCPAMMTPPVLTTQSVPFQDENETPRIQTNFVHQVRQTLRDMESRNGLIELPTGGQPICYQRVVKPRKLDVKDVSPETLRKRKMAANEFIMQTLGEDGENYMIAENIARKNKEERENLLKEMGLQGEMNEEEGLAMILDLNATWTSFRKLKK